ncbi:MAG: gluconate 2-dehydrogenase subunit 3 family protein [Actinomycetota bacterium]|nr:gluconate 2-dehydrogenase subunit 3 family protein [Actinomycetota bacterium]
MAEDRYPTTDEFWTRLDEREVEPDLRAALRERTAREEGAVERVGDARLVEAVAALILPGAVPARALAVFLDQHFDRQLGRADERSGLMPRGELIPAGFRVLDQAARTRHARPFVDLSTEMQQALLHQAEEGALDGPDRFDSAQWFKRVAQLLMLGFGSDPRGMVEMGFPGPSYKPGHIWLDRFEVEARAERRRGYRTL